MNANYMNIGFAIYEQVTFLENLCVSKMDKQNPTDSHYKSRDMFLQTKIKAIKCHKMQ